MNFSFGVSALVFLFLLVQIQTQIIIPNCTQITDQNQCMNTEGCTTTICNGTFVTWASSCSNYIDLIDCQAIVGCAWNGCQGSGVFWSCGDFFKDPISCNSHVPNCTWDFNNNICAGNYTPEYCSEMYNMSMCTSAIGCDWMNNTCMSCNTGNGECTANGTFQGYKPCSQIHESFCTGTNGCSTSCSGTPAVACLTAVDPVACSNLPGCYWRKNACFGNVLNIPANCSTAPTSTCASFGCNVVQLNGSSGSVCTNSPCYDIMNPDLCNAIVGCAWYVGACYVGTEKLIFPTLLLFGMMLVYLLQYA